jgi:hypothetical protein
MRMFLLALFLVLSVEAKSIFSNKEQADSSVYIESLKDLVIATQKTRGLTNAYLNGNTATMLLIYSNRDEMKKAIDTMKSLSLASDPIIGPKTTVISRALLELNKKAFKLKPTDTFIRYTQYIKQTLALAQIVSKRFSKNLNPFGQEASSLMMEIMLPMTEYIGQMRGFGSGLAAKGSITKKELKQLKVLSAKIKSLNSRLQINMIQLTARYPKKLPQIIKIQIATINKNANLYTTFTEKKFTNSISNIDPNTYFDNGVKLVSSIIKAYDTINKAILEDSKGWI